MSHKQDEEMDILNLFIEYHYKSIVSIIRERHVLTLHLSTANCRRKLITGCCCKNAAALYCTHYAIYFYQIESYHSSSSCGPLSMHFNGILILLYFIEVLPCMVSISNFCPNPCKFSISIIPDEMDLDTFPHSVLIHITFPFP